MTMKKIEKLTGGYLVEYNVKSMWHEPTNRAVKAICTREELIKLLQDVQHYTVWYCNRINVYRYLENHPDEELELRGFEK